MSVRKGHKDIMEEDDMVRVVLDLSSVKGGKLNLELTIKTLFVRHNPSGSVLEIEMPCKVKEIIKYTFNNGVLDVEIKR